MSCIIHLSIILLVFSGEGYQQLLQVLQSMEAERTKQSCLVERLKERLSRAQEETSSLQSSMAQRASHYQSLHTELLDKVRQVTDTEKEASSFSHLLFYHQFYPESTFSLSIFQRFHSFYAVLYNSCSMNGLNCNISSWQKLFIVLCFTSVEEKKCTCGCTGKTVTRENVSL